MPDAATRVRNYRVGSQGGHGALRNLQTVSLFANTAQGRPSNRKYVEMEAGYVGMMVGRLNLYKC